MKIRQLLLLLSIFSILMSCKTKDVAIVNRKIIDPEGEPMLIGLTTRDAFKAPEFNDWYSSEYDSYVPNPEVIKKLKSKTRMYHFEVFFGTWCSDTHEQLPRFMKILNEARYPEQNLCLYGVNKKKQSFYSEETQRAIVKIPTFIVYKGNREIGRIVEAPKETLELDLYKIIMGEEFKSKELKKIIK